MIKDILDFATKAHSGQKRKNAIVVNGIQEYPDYIVHPIAVAEIAEKIILSTNESAKNDGFYKNWIENKIKLVKSVALLHDVVEDTDYTIEDIRNLFGDKIAIDVDMLTHYKHEDYFDYFKRILESGNINVKIVKFADITHNLSTAGNFISKHKVQLWKLAKYNLGKTSGIKEVK